MGRPEATIIDLTPKVYTLDAAWYRQFSNCQGPEGVFLRNTSTALILNRFSPRLIRLKRRLVRTMSDTEPTKTGARMNLSHLRRVRKERRKNKGRVVPLDSSLLMGDPSHKRIGPSVRKHVTCHDVFPGPIFNIPECCQSPIGRIAETE